MSRRPLPGPARRLLGLALPSDWRDDILRDLEEAWGARADRSRVRAALWLSGQVVLFAGRFLPARVGELAASLPSTSLDLRLALRSARRAPWLTALTVIALALGIGATAGAFGLIQGAFFVELPHPGGERIHVVEDYNATRSYALRVGTEEFVRRRDELRSFEYFGAYRTQWVVIDGERRVAARSVTPDILRMTETAPAMGRLPDEDDAKPGSPPVVLLPHDLWVEMGSRPDVVGSTVEVAGTDRTVIGVMPEGFGFPWGGEIWLPLDPRATDASVEMLGKLREGVSPATARAELAVVARPDPAELEAPDDDVRHLVTKLTRPVTGSASLLFLAAPLVGLVLVLLVMATNVATVVLARNAARSGELAVRVALGASRLRVVGQLALEVAVAVAVAAAVGLLLAQQALRALAVWITGLPVWVDLSLRPAAVVFTVGLAGLATLVAGVAPALRATAGGLDDHLKEGGRGSSTVRFGRLTDVVVVAELALSVGFLSSAAILGEGLLGMARGHEGLPTTETLVSYVYFGWPEALGDPESGLSDDERARVRDDFLAGTARTRDRILERARTLPGVRRTAAASRFPGDESERMRVEADGGLPRRPATAEVVDVGTGWFALLDAGPIRGRLFTPAEHADGGDVALVDEPFARAHFGTEAVVGRRLRLRAGEEADGVDPPWLEIVGVVPDLGFAVGDPERGGTVYRPLAPTSFLWLGLRGDGSPDRWTAALVELVREVAPAANLSGLQTLERLVALPRTVYRGLGAGFLALGAIALLLSAASLHALTACAVTRRTRELGIRRALGAGTAGLAASVVRRTSGQLALGCLVGALLGYGLLRLAAIFPWRLGAGSPVFLAVVPLLLGLAILAALAAPLARALGIRPADALRHE